MALVLAGKPGVKTRPIYHILSTNHAHVQETKEQALVPEHEGEGEDEDGEMVSTERGDAIAVS